MANRNTGLHKLNDYQCKNAMKSLGDGGDLWLKVKARPKSKEFAKCWEFRFQRPWTMNGRPRTFYIGSYPKVGLKEARDDAAAARAMLKALIDPIEAQKQAILAKIAAQPKPLFELVDDYVTNKMKGNDWKNKDIESKRVLSTFKLYAPKLMTLNVRDITDDEIRDTLTPIWHDTTAGARLHRMLEAVFDLAKVRKLISGTTPVLTKKQMNIAASGKSPTRSERHPHVPYADMPAFWRSLTAIYHTGSAVLQFQCLTAARPGEARHAVWSEIDFQNKTRTIPAERMKAGEEHIIPLSDAAIRILRQQQQCEQHLHPDDYVFLSVNNNAFTDVAIARILKQTGYVNVTMHGFRRSFRNWAEEATNNRYTHRTIEKSLAHTVSNVVEGQYNTAELLEFRRTLLTEWAEYLAKSSVVENLIDVPQADT